MVLLRQTLISKVNTHFLHLKGSAEVEKEMSDK